MRLARAVIDRLAALGEGRGTNPEHRYGQFNELYHRLRACDLFDSEAYLAHHEDVRNAGEDPWWHFLRHGLDEGRQFTSPESAATALARAQQEITDARRDGLDATLRLADQTAAFAEKLRKRQAKIAIYCSRRGNFYMEEIADLLLLGLQSCGIDAVKRDEDANQMEIFDVRIFVAPHEFFYLGPGKDWEQQVTHPSTVLFNVEQRRRHGFAKRSGFCSKHRLSSI